MPDFIYKALDRQGKTVKGRIAARDEDEAYTKIGDMKLAPYELRKASSDIVTFKLRRKIKLSEYARYIRQFATLLDAGVTLLDALTSLSRSAAHPALSDASRKIAKDLRAGTRLSVAIKTHMPHIPNYVPRVAELGEITGKTSKALMDCAERMDFEIKMRSEVKTALSYPTFLAVIGSLIVIFMFIFVVPRFGSLVQANNADLPAISALVINTGMFFQANKALVAVILLVFVALIISISKNPVLMSKVRDGLNDAPIIGPLLTRSEIGGWARTVGMALDNGADILTALSLGESGLKSYKLRRAMAEVRTEIRAGRNIDDILQAVMPQMDPLTIDLIRTGRQSGKLAELLLFVGKTEEDETQELAKRLATIAEPTAILFISLIVGTIVISIVLAMTSLYDFAV